jgi:enoyl-CoA hydratase
VTTPGTQAGPLVRTERRGSVLLVGLARPAKHNALDEAMVGQLDGVLAAARQEACILVLYSSTPGMFAAGADIAELVDRDADAALRGINSGLFDRLEAHPWPTIAAIDGPAYGGGCELALACDLRVASPGARFAQPELGLGILAGAGANWRLPQTAGLSVARRMLYAGEVLDADAALHAGLVDAVHPRDSLLDEAVALGERIAHRSWRALELTKLALRAHRPATTGFDLVAQAVLFESDDKRERMNRFLDERARRRRERSADEDGASAGPAGAPDPVPPFRIRELTVEDGMDLAGWSRPGAWGIEDALERPAPDEGYRAVVDSEGHLLGYCCLGAAARVPGVPRDSSVVDVAVGIRPELAGRGWSTELGRAAVEYAASVAADRRLRSTVPEWNTAGRRAAELAGFSLVGARTYADQLYEVFEQPTSAVFSRGKDE